MILSLVFWTNLYILTFLELNLLEHLNRRHIYYLVLDYFIVPCILIQNNFCSHKSYMYK